MERLLCDILNIDTQNPPGNERVLAEWIARYLADAPCGASVRPISGQRANVVARIPGHRREGALLLNGHLDTVPHGGGWLTPPGTASQRDGCLHARGASDMKSGLAAALFAFREYARSGETPRTDILFAGTADEESGGLGAAALMESGEADGVGAIVIGEPTGNRPALAAKGAIWLRATVTGRVSHGAYPERGVNAIEGAMRFAEAVRGCLSGAHPLLTPPTATVTGLTGGIKQNMVPDRAELLMDVRTVPGAAHAALIDTFQAAARALSVHGLWIDLEVLNDRAAVTVGEDAPIVRALTACCREELGEAPNPVGTAFFSDASIFLKYGRFDAALFGPGESDQAHTPNERVSLAAYRDSIRVYRALIARWAREAG